MKKLISIVSSLLFVTIISAKAGEIGIGITGAAHMLDGSGTETTRSSGERNSGSNEETTLVPEVFIEVVDEAGYAFGLSYIPTRDVGNKSRTDTSAATGQESGTYTANAELENVFQVYTDIPTGAIGQYPVHLKLGIQHVTIATLESLNSGSSYPDEDVLGLTVGLGTKGDLPYSGMYYKGEITYTHFDEYPAVSAGNKVEADLRDYAAKLSVGYKF